jgi:hypothetical protein
VVLLVYLLLFSVVLSAAGISTILRPFEWAN